MDITVQELKKRLDAGEKLLVIDVREQHEYDEFNIGAKHIPLGAIMGALNDLDDHKEEEIVVHCLSGGAKCYGTTYYAKRWLQKCS